MNPPNAISIADFERGKQDWPAPDTRYLQPQLPEPPLLPLDDVFSPRWARWVRNAAEAKAAPADYVLGAALAACGSLIGNTRWVSPWQGWAEPPVLWAAVIGSPSMNKSPGLDAVLTPLKKVEQSLRADMQGDLNEWRERADVAKLAEATWRDDVKAALKAGKDTPSRPDNCNPGKEPVLPRLSVTDATVEKLAVIVAVQPRGTLLARDELAGWLHGMSRYSGGGSDRPFWLEAYGGRSYTVERMGRDPVYISHMSVGVTGGIQPDRLRSLLMKADDDGLLARFMPIWPNAAPVKRPDAEFDERFIEGAIATLASLEMTPDDQGILRPWFVHFSEDARDLLDQFRQDVRTWEESAEGLLLSFIGKLPGLSVRLSLVLAMMEFASGEASEPREITVSHYGRAAHFIEGYLLPMARRSYVDASASAPEKAARALVELILENGWSQFTTREVLRSGRSGLASSAQLTPAVRLLEEADILRPASATSSAQGGRPSKSMLVNPAILRRPA